MRVGRYELTGARLGEGGYAKVVLGRDIETGEQVAVKLLDTRASKEKAASSEASIIREVAAMRRACVSGHPNVAKLHAYQRLDESRNH